MKTFIVLGMHRSATSLIARGLCAAGVHLGQTLMGPDQSNPWGHWEHMAVVDTNKSILSHAGGSWARPPAEDAILRVGRHYTGNFKLIMDRLYYEARHMPVPLVGIKHPTMTLTIKLWLPYLINPHFICCFREPKEVIKSLEKRNGERDWAPVVREYNLRLLSFLAERMDT